MSIKKPRAWHVMIALIGLLSCMSAHAQNATLLEEQYERVRAASSVAPLGPTPFGERVDLMSGALSFYATDVEVPLNSGLPLKLGRKFDTTKLYGGPGGVPNDETRVLGPNWDLDVPYMRGVFDLRTGWVGTGTTQLGSLNRCTGGLAPPSVSGQIQFSNREYTPSDYSGGTFINLPGAGEEEILGLPQNRPRPADGATYVANTRSEVRFSCLPSMKRGEGEGFVAVLPNGTKYYFDWMWKRDYHHIMDMYCNSAQGGIYVIVWGGAGINCSTGVALPRVEVFIYATRVEDRFGNSLTYAYDQSPTRPFRLLSITSNEGASIDLDYDGDGKLFQARSAGQTWQYNYGGAGASKNLSSVVLPGGLTWQFSGGTIPYFVPATTLWDVCNVRVGTMRSEVAPGVGEASTFTVTHPGGAVGEFKVRRLVQGMNRTIGSCDLVRFGYVSNGFDAPVFYETPKAYIGVSLYEKTVTGPGVPTPLRWTYRYQPSWSWKKECDSGASCSDRTYTRVQDPSGVTTSYAFGNTFTDNYGLLLDVAVSSADGIERERTTYQYVMDATGQPFPASVGGIITSGRSVPVRARLHPVRQKTIQRDGVSFQSYTNAYDEFARPLSVTATGNGPPQNRTISYHDDLTTWVLGQVKERALDGVVYEQTTYVGRAVPHIRKSFGRTVQTETYAADGTVSALADGNGNSTTFSDWKRGIPRTVRFPVTVEAPSGATRLTAVSDRGWVESITDENGYITAYGYDDAGRITRIEHPSGDAVDWNVETIAYQKTPVPAFGLGAGLWWRTHRVGKRVSSTVYDALQRPLVEQVYDDTAFRYASTVSQIVRRYDAAGRLAFESYPLRRTIDTSLDWSTESQGTSYWYDALGRTTKVRQASELGSLDTDSYYLQGGAVQVVNPRQKVTTTSFRFYDEPKYDLPIRVEEPEGVTTEITRDAFGAVQVIARLDTTSGVQVAREFSYDSQHQLCRTYEPETGATVMGYDGSGNLAWSVHGLSQTTACAPRNSFPSAEVIARAYDSRSRLTGLSFPDGRGDQTRTYWADGLLKSISTFSSWPSPANVSNTYAYNKRRLLSSEAVSDEDGFTWRVDYSYDKNGSLSGLVYPSGLRIDYTPNELGQASQAGEYASSAHYHPNGGISDFRYGNGIENVTKQNERGFIDISSDGAAVHLDGYDYDQVGNVVAISDGTAGAPRERNMAYDGRDRLGIVTAPSFGSASYAYDQLDNLTRVVVASVKARNHWYCYDGRNRLTNIKVDTCNGTTVGALGYDPRGNVVNKNGALFDFDYGNRLRRAVGVEDYSYDGNGLRVATRGSGRVVRSFYTRSGQLLTIRDEQAKQSTDYVSLSGRLVARIKTDMTVPFLTVEGGNEGAYQARWSAVAEATKYVLEEVFGTTTTIEDFAASDTQWSFTGRPVGQYRYRVRACFGTDCRPWSQPKFVTVRYKPTMKPIITLPSYSFDGSYSAQWTAVVRAERYEFEEFISGAWVQLIRDLNVLEWGSPGRPDGTYKYRVRGCNGAGCGPDSDERTITVVRPPNGVPVISAPTLNYSGSYAVTWSGGIAGATRYELDELAYGAWSTHNATSTNFPISNRDTGSYSYRVRACNVSCAGNSATVTVQVLRPPGGAPSISAPIINTTGTFSIGLQPVWSADRYVVEEQTGSSGWYVVYNGGVGQVGVSNKSSGYYNYRGSACNDAGCGNPGPSVQTQVVLAPKAAPALYVDGIGWEGEGYSVSWTGVVDATSYELVSDTNNNYAWWGAYSGSGTSWWSPGQGAGLYGYMVRGCNWVGCGPWSSKQIIDIQSRCSFPPCNVEVMRREEQHKGDDE